MKFFKILKWFLLAIFFGSMVFLDYSAIKFGTSVLFGGIYTEPLPYKLEWYEGNYNIQSKVKGGFPIIHSNSKFPVVGDIPGRNEVESIYISKIIGFSRPKSSLLVQILDDRGNFNYIQIKGLSSSGYADDFSYLDIDAAYTLKKSSHWISLDQNFGLQFLIHWKTFMILLTIVFSVVFIWLFR